METQRQAYRTEAYELLSELETSLLELEETPTDREIIGRVFRAMHTIKGSGAMFGFDDIATFTHDVETIFDLVRNDRMAVTKNLIDLTLAAGDQIRNMLDADTEQGGPPSETVKGITASLRALLPRSEPAAGVLAPGGPAADDAPAKDATYRIAIHLAEDIFMRGTNPLLLLNELRELGECRVMARLSNIPGLETLNPENCYTTWDVLLTTTRGVDAIKDVFIFVEDECELKIQAVDEAAPLDDYSPPRLGDILLGRGDVSPEMLQQSLGKQKRIGELLVEEGVGADQVEMALVEQEHVKSVRQKQQQAEQASSVRVPAERLDKLVNLVGELVTVQARLSQTVAPLDDSDLIAISEEVDRLTTELRDNTMSIRMLPIGITFSKFKRLVRDLSSELGKEVLMETEGAETELDKTVIERLNDPLVHLIRNCIDHGIETPAVRLAAGKPRQGTVHLSAGHSGASVLIRIKDDGAGLNAAALRAKAVEKGLITEDTELSEKDTFGLIFAAGFSTAQQITSVSGRGVGMDVVKRSIDALRGSIEVTSKANIGTTITLKLPLTLAIIDGLLVQVGEGCFVIPLSIVEECVELTREDVARSHGRNIIHVRGEIVPFIQLRERFVIAGERPDVEQIVITESTGGRVGFVVDKVIGEHQTVIKGMGRMYEGVDVISGATILGNGTVALIMDIPKLVEGVELQEVLEE